MYTNLAYVYEHTIDLDVPIYFPANQLILFEQQELSGANEDQYHSPLDDDCCNLYTIPV